MATNLDKFLNHMLVDLPGCPDPTARYALLIAAGEFCRTSLCWDEFQDAEPLQDGVAGYDLFAPAGASVYMVKEVWIGSRMLTPLSMSQLQVQVPAWQTAQTSTPLYYNAATDRGTLTLYPTPKESDGQTFVVRVAYAPTVTATTLPDFLFERYLDAVTSGAKARLMATPGHQPYSQPALAAYHREVFLNGIVLAQNESMHERVQGTVTVAPRTFGF